MRGVKFFTLSSTSWEPSFLLSIFFWLLALWCKGDTESANLVVARLVFESSIGAIHLVAVVHLWPCLLSVLSWQFEICIFECIFSDFLREVLSFFIGQAEQEREEDGNSCYSSLLLWTSSHFKHMWLTSPGKLHWQYQASCNRTEAIFQVSLPTSLDAGWVPIVVLVDSVQT
jgi:hypothetical protein